MFRAWCKDASGTTAVVFALMLPTVMLLVGIAIDQSAVQSHKSKLQIIADDAALHAVREMAIARNDPVRIQEVAVTYVNNVQDIAGISARGTVDLTEKTVSLQVAAPPRTFFMNQFGMVKNIEVSATAKLVGEAGNICLIALNDTARRTIELNERARLTADNCALYANSMSPQSLRVASTAQITVAKVFLAGGYLGNIRGLTASPVTDVPQVTDPLAGRKPPLFGSCDFSDHIAVDDSPLDPGVYCGGLHVDGADVELRSGEYIIQDGPLIVNNGGSISGTGVGFYLTGSNAKLDFAADSHIDLAAPRSGSLIGLLFFADKNNPLSNSINPGTGLLGGHVIRSNDARRLVGTIYLPDDKLVIDGETPVADQSEYTVIVAQAFELFNGPNLVIQTDYAASDIPVPDGLGPMDSTTALIIN